MHKQVTRAVHKTSKRLEVAAKSLPQKYFVSPEVFAAERKKIFAENWLLVGHQNQIPRAGDYIVRRVNEESLIVIRDKSAKINGFFNVCRHRGSRLIENDRGNCAAIQCPYHAWTY